MALFAVRTPRGVAVDQVNLCTNPSFEVNTADWVYEWFGTAGAGTNDRSVGANFGDYFSGAAIRKTWTTGTANPNEAGFSYQMNWNPGQTRYVSASMRSAGQSVVGAIRVKFANGSGTVLDTQTADAKSMFTGAWLRYSGAFTAPAGTTNARIYFILDEHNGTIPAGTGLLLDAVLITDTVQSGYFDGNTAPSGVFTYAWQGAAHNSMTSRMIPDPATSVLPDMVLGWDESSASNNIVHQLLDPTTVAVVLRAGGMRTGVLKLWFLTRAQAMSAKRAHQGVGTWEYADDDNPETHLIYVVDGSMRCYNDENRLRWTLEVPFREVFA